MAERSSLALLISEFGWMNTGHVTVSFKYHNTTLCFHPHRHAPTRSIEVSCVTRIGALVTAENTIYHIPGVNGGDPQRAQSPPAKFSAWTSSSQPSLTPSKLSWAKNMVLTGVGRTSQLDGLLIALAEADRGGVDG